MILSVDQGKSHVVDSTGEKNVEDHHQFGCLDTENFTIHEEECQVSFCSVT